MSFTTPVNSPPPPPSAAYMLPWIGSAFAQIMAWLVAYSASSHYVNVCWNIVNWTLGNKLQWNFNRSSNIFIQENAFENVVCEKASILFWPQCVKVGLMNKLMADHTIMTYWFKLASKTVIKTGYRLVAPWTEWPPFRRWYFQMLFCEWKVLYFDRNFPGVCS